MKIVKASSLGSNCWSALRFTTGCFACERYDRCNYPERVSNEEYDALIAQAQETKKASENLFRQAKEMRGR